MFEPWIGPVYGDPNDQIGSKRLLVVAEGHHADGPDFEVGSVHPEFTLETVNAYKEAEWRPWMRTFDNIAAAISGKSKRELGRPGVNSVWDSIAFYNYIPVIAASAARRERPQTWMFKAGAEPFRAVVNKLRPSALIVAGYRLWDEVVYRHAEPAFHVKVDPNYPFVRLADVGGRLALKMVHPSTAFSPMGWHQRVRELEDLVRRGG